MRLNGFFVELGDVIGPELRSEYQTCRESSRQPAAICSLQTSIEVIVSGRVRESTSLKFLDYIIRYQYSGWNIWRLLTDPTIIHLVL